MKLLSIVLIFLTISNSYAQINLNNGLVGCYPFTGNANDLSGKNNHGTVNGAKLTTDRFGNANSAYDFDGQDDYIEISPEDLQGNTFSYSLWIYPRSLPGHDQAFFFFSVGSASGDQDILIGNEYDNVLTGFSNGSYLGYDYNVRCTTNALPKLNQWYHIVLTKDINNYYFYIDGKLICASPTNGSSAYYGVAAVKATIGARFHYAQATDAIIDDVHLFDRSISQAEVLELYKGTTSPSAETITLTQDKAEPCGGEDIIITANSSNTALEALYEWEVDGTLQANVTGKDFLYKLPKKGSYYSTIVTVKVSYISCFPIEPTTQTKTVNVKNCESPLPETDPDPDPIETKTLHAPSAFSPNNDGTNDTWQLLNADLYLKLEVSIFSRWGEVIFKSSGYDKPWDGKYKGTIVAPGIYPFKIYSEGNLIKEGALNVLY